MLLPICEQFCAWRAGSRCLPRLLHHRHPAVHSHSQTPNCLAMVLTTFTCSGGGESKEARLASARTSGATPDKLIYMIYRRAENIWGLSKVAACQHEDRVPIWCYVSFGWNVFGLHPEKYLSFTATTVAWESQAAQEIQ